MVVADRTFAGLLRRDVTYGVFLDAGVPNFEEKMRCESMNSI
jgi:hypothetical protein